MGTVVTAAGLALAAHAIFGFGWQSALLLGTALSPTDPAVVFSVLAGREIAGRSGTILEGESGANDPVGIALLVSVIAARRRGLRRAHRPRGVRPPDGDRPGDRCRRGHRAALGGPTRPAGQRAALPDPGGRGGHRDLRSRDRRARVGFPGRVPRRHPARRRAVPVPHGGAAVHRRGRQPQRDGGVHRPRAEHPAAERARQHRPAGRPRDRRPARRSPPGRCSWGSC